MVQRKGRALYGFATNKTVRRIDMTAAKLSAEALVAHDVKPQFEEKKVEIREDVKQTKLMERKRILKNQQPIDFEIEEQNEELMTQLDNQFSRKFIQGVHITESGKQKIIYKHKNAYKDKKNDKSRGNKESNLEKNENKKLVF